MKMLRCESGIALMPVFHPGVRCSEKHKLGGPPEGNVCFCSLLGLAGFTAEEQQIVPIASSKGSPVQETRLQRASRRALHSFGECVQGRPRGISC
jgi:hypothetical protein